MKKLLQKQGETLIESLVSILLVTFIMLFLSTAIVAAARINKRLRDTDISYKANGTEVTVAGEENPTVKVRKAESASGQDAEITSPISVYKTTNGYVYYRYPSAANKGATP